MEPQKPEFSKASVTSRAEGKGKGMSCPKKCKRGIYRVFTFLDHHNVPFGAGDDVGVCVEGDDVDLSLSCDDSPSNCSFP